MLTTTRVGLLVSLLSLTALTTHAQNAPTRSSLQLGIGKAWVGTGDYSALKSNLEYARPLGRHLGTGSRLAIVAGSTQSYNTVFNPQHPRDAGVTVPYALSYQAANLEQELYVYPFGNDKLVQFAVGVGGFAGYSNRYGAPSTRLNTTTNETFIELDHQRGLHAGYLFSLNFTVAVDPARNWLLGGKASFQNDTFGNSLATTQLTINRRF